MEDSLGGTPFPQLVIVPLLWRSQMLQMKELVASGTTPTRPPQDYPPLLGILTWLCLPEQTYLMGSHASWVSLRFILSTLWLILGVYQTQHRPCEPQACQKPTWMLQTHLQSSLFSQACPLSDGHGVHLPNPLGHNLQLMDTDWKGRRGIHLLVIRLEETFPWKDKSATEFLHPQGGFYFATCQFTKDGPNPMIREPSLASNGFNTSHYCVT